jgi:hypothetical protein
MATIRKGYWRSSCVREKLVKLAVVAEKSELTPHAMKAPFFPIQQFRVIPLVLTAAALGFAVAVYAQKDTQQVEDRITGSFPK